jgi:hypothetical protein
MSITTAMSSGKINNAARQHEGTRTFGIRSNPPEIRKSPWVEGPKDEYYSSLYTFDHDSALGNYPQVEAGLA